MTKIICRTDYKLSLSNVDRHNSYNSKDIKYVDKIIDYFSDEKKRVVNMLDYFTGKINKHEDYNLVLEDGSYATKEELEKRQKRRERFGNKEKEETNVIISTKEEIEQRKERFKDLYEIVQADIF